MDTDQLTHAFVSGHGVRKKIEKIETNKNDMIQKHAQDTPPSGLSQL